MRCLASSTVWIESVLLSLITLQTLPFFALHLFLFTLNLNVLFFFFSLSVVSLVQCLDTLTVSCGTSLFTVLRSSFLLFSLFLLLLLAVGLVLAALLLLYTCCLFGPFLPSFFFLFHRSFCAFLLSCCSFTSSSVFCAGRYRPWSSLSLCLPRPISFTSDLCPPTSFVFALLSLRGLVDGWILGATTRDNFTRTTGITGYWALSWPSVFSSGGLVSPQGPLSPMSSSLDSIRLLFLRGAFSGVIDFSPSASEWCYGSSMPASWPPACGAPDDSVVPICSFSIAPAASPCTVSSCSCGGFSWLVVLSGFSVPISGCLFSSVSYSPFRRALRSNSGVGLSYLGLSGEKL